MSPRGKDISFGKKHRQAVYKRKYSYNMGLQEYNDMFREQNGCCAICGIHQSKLNRALAVDHNHATGEIRGLLCTTCNTGLGQFKENPEFLENAKNYLNKHNK